VAEERRAEAAPSLFAGVDRGRGAGQGGGLAARGRRRRRPALRTSLVKHDVCNCSVISQWFSGYYRFSYLAASRSYVGVIAAGSAEEVQSFGLRAGKGVHHPASAWVMPPGLTTKSWDG